MNLHIIVLINLNQIYLNFILMEFFQLVRSFFLTKDLNFPFHYSVLICINVRLVKFLEFMEKQTFDL